MILGVDDKSSCRIPVGIENQEGINVRWLYTLLENVLQRARKGAVPPTIARLPFLFD
jgi:hypothetical protein